MAFLLAKWLIWGLYYFIYSAYGGFSLLNVYVQKINQIILNFLEQFQWI